MSAVDISILIVHATDTAILRQTLRGIRRVAPRLNYELILVDNNISAGLGPIVVREFPDVQYIPLPKNIGFGAGMNVAIPKAKGKYVLIFNPDIIPLPGSLENIFRYMEDNIHIGVCGPQLLNADGSLQYSCYRIPHILMPILRRTPLGKLGFTQRLVDEYLMKDAEHDKSMEVDSLLGGAMFTRRSALIDVGLFDEQFFLYYEDNDLSRRFWEKGYPVVYYPHSKMIHYHRRHTADGNIIQQLFSWKTWVQIISFLKYTKKYWRKENPRNLYGGSTIRTRTGEVERAG